MLFNRKREEKIQTLKEETKAIQTQVCKEAASTTREAKRLRDLLAANGITLRIYIATGGDHRGHR